VRWTFRTFTVFCDKEPEQAKQSHDNQENHMPTPLATMLILSVSTVSNAPSAAAEETSRLAELDALWARVSRAVREGNFKLYASTCHKDGVLVTGLKQQCYPLSKALARWKKGFDATRAGKTKAGVTFRFSRRLGDETTAHETGIFHYTATTAGGKTISDYIHFEALLLKRDGWKIMMEHQKSSATAAEWEALKQKSGL
jgi:hypothetical protein